MPKAVLSCTDRRVPASRKKAKSSLASWQGGRWRNTETPAMGENTKCTGPSTGVWSAAPKRRQWGRWQDLER
eukprot:8422044-Alexandrium_andersonii.AAC.1